LAAWRKSAGTSASASSSETTLELSSSSLPEPRSRRGDTHHSRDVMQCAKEVGARVVGPATGAHGITLPCDEVGSAASETARNASAARGKMGETERSRTLVAPALPLFPGPDCDGPSRSSPARISPAGRLLWEGPARRRSRGGCSRIWQPQTCPAAGLLGACSPPRGGRERRAPPEIPDLLPLLLRGARLGTW